MSNLSGATTAVFIVRLSAALEVPVTVAWKTKDGTAKAGTDYEAASGSVTFEPGETTKQIQVSVYGREAGDTETRTFSIELYPPENAILDQTLTEVKIEVTDESGVAVTSLVVATGPRGLKGDPGLSAFELAKLQGYEGTLEQWIQQQTAAGISADRSAQEAYRAASEADRAEDAASQAEAVIDTEGTYPDIASGIAATPSGKYFRVPQGTASETSFIYYRNNSGTAVAVAATVGKAAVGKPVTPEMTTFFVKSKNLFDKSAVTVDMYVDSTTGTIKANAKYDASDWIPVTAGQVISANNSHQWAFYDTNKVYLSGIAAGSTNTDNRTVTVPANAHYLRATIAKTLVDTFQIEVGAAVTSYEPFGMHIEKTYLLPMEPANLSITEAKIAAGAVTPAKTSDIFEVKVSKNLFNKATVVDGYINPPTGNVTANSSYKASDFIPVVAGQVYTQSPYRHSRAFYDASKTFITGVAQETPFTSNLTWTAPANAAFVRVTVGIAYVDTFQLEKGDTATSYEPYYAGVLKLMEKYLPDNLGGDVKNEVVAARGSAASLNARITPTIDVNGMSTAGRFQPEFLSMTRYKLRKIKRNDSGGPYQYTLAIPGDSYTHSAPRYTQNLATDLRAEYGDAGAGWVGFGFPSTDTISNGKYPNQNGNENTSRMSQTYSGTWTGVYASGNSPDICACHSANVGDKITVNWLVASPTSSLKLFAKGGAGVVRYRFANDGGAFGAWTTIDLTAATGLSLTVLTGYGAGKWALEIEVVSGDPYLYGLDHSLPTAGIRIHKLGATGSRAEHWANADAAEWSAAIAALNPDCVAIFLAPNDQKVYPPLTFKGYVKTMIDRVRSAVPQADILLVVAPSNGTSNEALRPMPGYAQAAYQLAYENNCAAMSLQKYFGPNYADYGYGSAKNWFSSDHLHPDAPTGGRVILDAFYRLLTQS